MNDKDTRAAIYGPGDKQVKFASVLFPHHDATKLQSMFMAPELPRVRTFITFLQNDQRLNLA
jgi:hypothetical protein